MTRAETRSAARLLADIRAGQTDRQRAERAHQLAAGDWTPAGDGLQVRLDRPC